MYALFKRFRSLNLGAKTTLSLMRAQADEPARAVRTFRLS
jgi:hypothetical protein